MAISCTCTHCGKSSLVDDHFAGQTGPCATCGQAITVPLPLGAPGTSPSAGAVGVLGTALGIGVACLVLCVGLGGLLVAIVLPALSSNPPAAQRAESTNNLKQITLALQNYHDLYGTFPPAYVTDAAGQPLYSWRVLLLPLLEESAVDAAFDKTKAWDDPANLAASNRQMSVFRSPCDAALPTSGTSYVCLVGSNTMFPAGTGQKLAAVTDGTSNTIMIVEVSGLPGSWAAPLDPTLSQFSGPLVGPSVGQLHPAQLKGGMLVGLADGTVRHLNSAAVARVVQPAAFTVNDGQVTPVE